MQGVSSVGASTSGSCSGTSSLLSSPWPLWFACQIILGSMRKVGKETGEGSATSEACATHQQQQQQQQLLQPLLPPHLLCLQTPVPAHADLAAAALSLVRLIVLRLRGRAQRSMHGMTHARQQGAAPTGVSAAAPAASSSEAEAAAEQQGLQCHQTVGPRSRAAADAESTQSLDAVQEAEQQ
eukprot:scaffold54659_cov17-Tisochrysis_lutea.AAC.1